MAAIALLLAGVFAAVQGEPGLEDRLAAMRVELADTLETRNYHIDSGELLALMHNNMIRLVIADVRPEPDYNLFHLRDARHADFTAGRANWLSDMPEDAVVVIVANGEGLAGEGWMRARAMGVKNAYVLERGLNEWLNAYHGARQMTGVNETCTETLEYRFDAALGERHAESAPEAGRFRNRWWDEKVRVLKPVTMPAGGCGG